MTTLTINALLARLDYASLDSTRAPDARRILAQEANDLRATIQRNGDVAAQAAEAERVLAMWAVVSATITHRGVDSTVPDNPGAVDAVITVDHEQVGKVTLLPDHDGYLQTWGSLENWASQEIMDWLDGTDEPRDAIEEIVAAVREVA